MNLTEQEKLVIQEMQRNPAFSALLKKLSDRTVPKWKAGADEQAKVHQWIYDSGFVAGVEYVIKHLGYDNGR